MLGTGTICQPRLSSRAFWAARDFWIPRNALRKATRSGGKVERFKSKSEARRKSTAVRKHWKLAVAESTAAPPKQATRRVAYLPLGRRWAARRFSRWAARRE